MQRTRNQREAEAAGVTPQQLDLIKEPDNEVGGRWARRQKLIKQYVDDGLSRKQAIKIARQSIPKR